MYGNFKNYPESVLQYNILVFDSNQKVTIPFQRADFLLKLLHVIHSALEDGSLVDSAVFSANVAAGALDVPR